jgi:hypothetical protein
MMTPTQQEYLNDVSTDIEFCIKIGIESFRAVTTTPGVAESARRDAIERAFVAFAMKAVLDRVSESYASKLVAFARRVADNEFRIGCAEWPEAEIAYREWIAEIGSPHTLDEMREWIGYRMRDEFKMRAHGASG